MVVFCKICVVCYFIFMSEYLDGEGFKEKTSNNKVGRVSKWVAGGTLALAGVAGPGMILGWRDARADQARVEKTQLELAETKQTLERDQTNLNEYLAGLGVACRSAVDLYLWGVNRQFLDSDAQSLVSRSGTCGDDQGVVVTARSFNYAVEQGKQTRDQEQADLIGQIRDAQQNDELWQGALVSAVGIGGAVAFICREELFRGADD